MHKCVKRIKELAESVGACLDESVLETMVIVDAPAGYVWSANGSGSVSSAAGQRGQTWYAEACKDVAGQMACGLHKCDPEESERIEYERDEPWTAPADAPKFIAVTA